MLKVIFNKNRSFITSILWFNGVKAWRLDGRFHRENGPAIQYTCKKSRLFLQGIEYRSEKGYNAALKRRGLD